MKKHFISIALAAAVVMLGSDLALAADTVQASPKVAPASQTKAATKTKTKATAKLVDINSASSAELKKLPGITESEATKIIAGRPYGSKAWLVTHKVLTEDKYAAISQLVVAKQPYKDAAKNAALYKKK